MAKRIKAGELDESLIIQSFKNTELLDNPADALAPKPSEQPTGDIPEPEETVPDTPVAEPVPKSKPRRRKGSYDEVFLNNKDLKARQPVYISKEIHADIKKVVNLLALTGKEMSVGGYINNVLADHLEQYKEDIDDLHQKIREL